MISMTLGNSTLESLTPSVNIPPRTTKVESLSSNLTSFQLNMAIKRPHSKS
jgi:hypothetical protein